ncbi:MAG: stage 0 sporulation protein [Chloroflexi bacterium]|nr:stage 0 sporulation protein [Chloroflexota bacterium]
MTTFTEDQPTTAPSLVAGVRFFEVGKVYHFSFDHLPDLMIGDYVIVETARGAHLGQVMNMVAAGQDDGPRDYKPIVRKATPTDLMSQKLWKGRETETLIACREKADELGGYEGTKFIAVEYNFDGSLLTLMFSAEDKLNTTRLRTALQRNFKAKIELRQIGPRDIAKYLGGLGACGIERCCSTFLTDFSPISIKMAKAQGISLNPSEITGMCGRLRCCLIYEYEQYVDARKELPKRNKRVGTPHGEGKVIDVHPLRDAVTVLVGDTMHVVEREQLIPLEEWEALKSKSEAGCAKDENGGCDCGKHAPAEESSDETLDAQDTVLTHYPLLDLENETEPDEPEGSSPPPAQPEQRKPRRGKSGHGKSHHSRSQNKRKGKPDTSHES